MLIHLPPSFEAAAHAGDIFETIFDQERSRAQTAIAVVTIDDNGRLFIRILQKFLHIPVGQMHGSRNVGRAVGAWITNIDERACFAIQFLLCLMNLNLRYVVHDFSPLSSFIRFYGLRLSCEAGLGYGTAEDAE